MNTDKCIPLKYSNSPIFTLWRSPLFYMFHKPCQLTLYRQGECKKKHKIIYSTVISQSIKIYYKSSEIFTGSFLQICLTLVPSVG